MQLLNRKYQVPVLAPNYIATINGETVYFFACVYRFSMTTEKPSTESANEEKKCLVVKSEKVKTSLFMTK